MEIPPKSSLMYEFDFVSINMVLIYDIWENISDVFMFKDKSYIKNLARENDRDTS